MAYDHHKKAGNKGDCFKHPPLIAALDTVLQVKNKEPFHYLDVFAGHAWHQLLDGNEYEWQKGIGKLALSLVPDDAPASVKCWWGMWHDASDWPTTKSPGYPGSSWIAAHRCRNAERAVKLELYDPSEEARRDLERAFPASHAIQNPNPNVCLIGQSLGLAQQEPQNIEKADFVFIDPPGWRSEKRPSYPDRKDFFEHVLKPRGEKKSPTLVWMPSAGNNSVFKGTPKDEIVEAAILDYRWSAVRWQVAGPGTACILVYNCAERAIREAIKSIAVIPGLSPLSLECSVIHSPLPNAPHPNTTESNANA